MVTSQPDTVDMTVTFLSAHRRLGPKSDRIEKNSHPCTAHFAPTFASSSTLAWTMTRCSLTIQTSMKSLTCRETHSRTLDCSVFSQCSNPLFRKFLMIYCALHSFRKQRKHASGNRSPDTEREKMFCNQCCIVDVKEKSTEQY